jgi:hypothetical protein
MFFRKKKPEVLVVHNYNEACEQLQKMGVNIRSANSVGGSIISNAGLSWQFIGDDDGLVISRAISAPKNWNEDALISWMYQKNFVVVVYDQPKNQFVIATHILLKGGVVAKNLARLVNNFDSSIRSFLIAMDIQENQLSHLE